MLKNPTSANSTCPLNICNEQHKCVQVVSFHTSCSGFLDSFDDDILEGHSCKISNFQNDTKAVQINTKP